MIARARTGTLPRMAKTPIEDDLTGKVALVTGATGGIGKEIARGLARLGATVIVGARDPGKGERVRDEIAKDAKRASDVSTRVVDVASLASIRSFATDLPRTHPALHVLVNNAGAWFTDRRESPDRHELTFATNVLGPYALTKLLTPSLKAANGARVVNVVSELATNYDVTDLEWTRRKFDGFKVYGQSKQALRMLTWHFASALAADGVMVNGAAPGFVQTDFNQNASGFVASMIGFFSRFMAVSPAEGADAPLWVAASSECASMTAKYIDGRKEKDGKFREPGPIAELVKACDAMMATP